MMNTINKESKLNQAMKLSNTRSYQERSVPKFLKKIYYILEENKFNDLLSWSNDGLALIIKKPTEFANRVLPLYFKHNNFSSFIRQLNMYKFKKRKNSHYDHIYSHEMFQRGKIDLLRNIQRRTAESSNVTPPAETLSNKFDNEIDVDKLIQENMQYKRVHKLLYTQVEYIENKMKDIKNEVAILQDQQKRSEANEKFLKTVLKSLTKVYGFENIAKVIQNDVEESADLCSEACEELNLQACSNALGQYFEANNESVPQLQRSGSEEDNFPEKTVQTSCECQLSEQLPTNDNTPRLFEKMQCCWNKDAHVEASNNILQVENWDQLVEDPENNGVNYLPPLGPRQFENKDNNSELVFCRTSSWFIGDLNNGDLLANRNQIVSDADF